MQSIKNILLVDDEKEVKKFVEESLLSLKLRVLYCTTWDEMQQALDKQNIELVILDIELGEAYNGIDLAQMLREKEPHIPIIFLTAHWDDMISALIRRCQPTAHLVKPVNPHQLLLSVKNALNATSPMTSDAAKENKPIAVRVLKQKVIIDPSSILYLEASGNYCIIHCIQDKYTSSHSLKSILAKLNSTDFVRVSRSSAVRLRAIRKISSESVEIINGHSLVVSKNYKSELQRRFMQL